MKTQAKNSIHKDKQKSINKHFIIKKDKTIK